MDRFIWHIDNPITDQIEPELQDLSVGSIVPDGEPGTAFYVVETVRAPRVLVLHSTTHVPKPLRDRMTVDWTWAFELKEPGPAITRLTLRVRATFEPWWVRALYRASSSRAIS